MGLYEDSRNLEVQFKVGDGTDREKGVLGGRPGVARGRSLRAGATAALTLLA